MTKIQICSNYVDLLRCLGGGVAASCSESSSSDSEDEVIRQMTASWSFDLGGVGNSNIFLVRFFLGGVLVTTSLGKETYSWHTLQISSSALQYASKTCVMNLYDSYLKLYQWWLQWKSRTWLNRRTQMLALFQVGTSLKCRWLMRAFGNVPAFFEMNPIMAEPSMSYIFSSYINFRNFLFRFATCFWCALIAALSLASSPTSPSCIQACRSPFTSSKKEAELNSCCLFLQPLTTSCGFISKKYKSFWQESDSGLGLPCIWPM